MPLKRILDTVELGLGTAILIAGLGLAALSASGRDFIGVFVGLSLFIAGYKLSQVGVRQSEESELTETVYDILHSARMIDLVAVLVGAGTISYGFVLTFQGIEQADIRVAIVASALMLVGYGVAHYAVNNTLV